MNIINILTLIRKVISRDWASIGKIITGTENMGVNRHILAEKLVIGGDLALAFPIETCFVEAPAGASRNFAEVGRPRTTSIAKRSKITYLIATFLAKVCLSKQKSENLDEHVRQLRTCSLLGCPDSAMAAWVAEQQHGKLQIGVISTKTGTENTHTMITN